MSFARTLVILGSTGSIGTSTLDVVSRHRDRFEVVALTGYSRVDLLARQCCEFNPKYAWIGTDDSAAFLRTALAGQGLRTEVLSGADRLSELATLEEADTVMAAIVGAAGLVPTLASARAGKRILLANKEALVMAGPVFMAEVRRSGAVLLPIDSEHNAVFQSLPVHFAGDLPAVGVRRILLTASGGPFRTTPLDELARVTPEQAMAHPNWVMGRKISVDSATMMNKGLEVIEAHWLFNAPAEKIEVVIHPQSVVHSLVDYEDGSVLAQLGHPDMRTPIAHALAWPQRIASGVPPLDLFAISSLSFESPDLARFPCLGLAYQALRSAGRAPAVLNAANEVAVSAFLDRRIAYPDIVSVVRAALDSVAGGPVNDIADVLEADRCGRAAATTFIAGDRCS